MAEPVSLAVVNQRIEELVCEYEATNSDDPQAADILAELSRLIGLSTALRRIRQETKHVPKNRLAIARAGFPTIEALYREMDNIARQIAETPRSQHRIELIDQLTRLCLLADSANKEKE
jgi:hypothetical protein